MSESAKIYSKEGPKIEKIEVLPPPPAQLRIVDYKHDVIIKPDDDNNYFITDEHIDKAYEFIQSQIKK